MAHYEKTVRLPHEASNLFELVSDIRHYPEFVRWIRSMRVSDEHQVDGAWHGLGEAQVGFRGFSERFATRVVADPKLMTIRANLVRGPFRYLDNYWTFHPLGSGETRVEFRIDYEFRNLVLKMLARNNIELAVRKIMDAFIAEADRRYARTAQAI